MFDSGKKVYTFEYFDIGERRIFAVGKGNCSPSEGGVRMFHCTTIFLKNPSSISPRPLIVFVF